MNRTHDIMDRKTNGSRACVAVPVLFTAFALFCGCASSRSPTPPDFSLSEQEARQAGALALYAKGILLENTTGGDTNANKQAATEAFRQAVTLDPGSRRPVEMLVNNLIDDARYADAFAAIEAYLAIHLDDTGLRLEAARMAEAAGRPAEAARHCAILVAQNPKDRALSFALIRLHFQADQVDEALRAMRDLYARLPDEQSAALPVSWAVYFTRESNDPERSLACLDFATPLRTNAADRAALMTLAAENRLMLGQTNVAESVLLQAYQTDPTANTALFRLGDIWAARPNATNHLAHLAQQATDPHFYLLLLATTCQTLKDNTAAIAALKEVYERRLRESYFPDENFYLWYASLTETTKRYPEIERILIDALTAHPTSHTMQNFLAYLWALQDKRLDEADRLVSAALAVMPENPAYLDTKGWVLFKKGRTYEALQFLLKAAEIDKREPEIFDHVGDVLKAIGHESEAILFWTRSHELSPNPDVEKKLRQIDEQ